MKVAIGSDHTGVKHRKQVKALLDSLGIESREIGLDTEEAVDYPDIAYEVATAVAERECDYGVIICGTGIGVGIVANKVPGVLAAVCHDEYSTRMSRRDDHANVLCLGAREGSEEDVVKLVDVWLKTPPEGGRHSRRVGKILQIEHDVLAKWCRNRTEPEFSR